MKSIYFFFKILILYFLTTFIVLGSESKYFNDGKKLFLKNDLEGSKYFFEKDIVFNPKSEMSYLYLAKIFENKENEVSEELNLNTVLMLNPKNEEAIYMLMQLRIKQSNFSEVEELIEKFKLICTSICSKVKDIENKLDNLSTNNSD